MAKQNENRNSKAILNLKSTANRTLSKTGNLATKAIDKTAKWLARDQTRAKQRTIIMELEQSANHHLASMALSNRRLSRLSKNVHRLINTSVGDNTFEVALGWLIDHAFYLWDLLWDFIWSIMSYLFMTIFSILLIVVFNVIFFYTLFWFLFL